MRLTPAATISGFLESALNHVKSVDKFRQTYPRFEEAIHADTGSALRGVRLPAAAVEAAVSVVIVTARIRIIVISAGCIDYGRRRNNDWHRRCADRWRRWLTHDWWAADNQRRRHGKRQIDSDAEVNAGLGGGYGSQQN